MSHRKLIPIICLFSMIINLCLSFNNFESLSLSTLRCHSLVFEDLKFHNSTVDQLSKSSKMSFARLAVNISNDILIKMESSEKPPLDLSESVGLQKVPDGRIEMIFFLSLAVYLIAYLYKSHKKAEAHTQAEAGEINFDKRDSQSLDFISQPGNNLNIIEKDLNVHIAVICKNIETQEKLNCSTKKPEKECQNDDLRNRLYRELQTQINEEDEKCIICYEADKSVIFGPCNHICACALCAFHIVQTSSKCPLCRTELEDVKLAPVMTCTNIIRPFGNNFI